MRLDPLDQHAAENVGPGVVVGDPDAGCRAPPRQARRGRSVAGNVARRSMPRMASKGLRDA